MLYIKMSKKKVYFDVQFAILNAHMTGSESTDRNLYEPGPFYQSEPKLGSRPGLVYESEPKIGSIRKTSG